MKRRYTSGWDILFHSVNGLIMVGVVMVTFFPFYYMVMLSLSSGDTYAKVLILPSKFSIKSFQLMMEKIDFFRNLFISVMRSIIGPIASIAVTFFGAYALSRRDLIFRKFFSRFVVFAMYFGAGILPGYLNMTDLHLTRTFAVYIIPRLVSVFILILIRTYIEDIPRSLEESAAIDGANDLQIAVVVVFPLCIPVLAAVTLFEFVSQWNSYMDTLLYNATVPPLFTLQYSLSIFLNMAMNISSNELSRFEMTLADFNLEGIKMAMTVVVCIPVLLVYPFLQKYFVKGIMVGSIKG
jgi:putative aldouronate transport system permease protein